MAKTRIYKADSRTARVEAEHDPMDWSATDTYTREFHLRGKYVYDENDKQVCAGLDRLGNTLTARDTDDLLSVIRAEWQARKRSAAAELTRAGYA